MIAKEHIQLGDKDCYKPTQYKNHSAKTTKSVPTNGQHNGSKKIAHAGRKTSLAPFVQCWWMMGVQVERHHLVNEKKREKTTAANQNSFAITSNQSIGSHTHTRWGHHERRQEYVRLSFTAPRCATLVLHDLVKFASTSCLFWEVCHFWLNASKFYTQQSFDFAQ